MRRVERCPACDGAQTRVPVGYSDHAGEVAPGHAAVVLGAKAVEVHVTWSKQCFGPDVKASLTFEQLAELARGIRLLERSLENNIDKDIRQLESC